LPLNCTLFVCFPWLFYPHPLPSIFLSTIGPWQINASLGDLFHSIVCARQPEENDFVSKFIRLIVSGKTISSILAKADVMYSTLKWMCPFLFFVDFYDRVSLSGLSTQQSNELIEAYAIHKSNIEDKPKKKNRR
jgi:hypothetical protein